MSTVVHQPRPMSLLSVDFGDLYARHLCRHSQFGINVIHLIALYGVWFGVYAAIYWLVGEWWVPTALAAAYLGLVALNAPLRVVLATAGFLALLVGGVVCLPNDLPWWTLAVYAAMVPAFYQLQNLSHKIYTDAADMTEFNKRYPKGRLLFVVLLVNEVPILVNYLLFGVKDWR
ncbi:MAG TPA: hypothetical protein VFE62_26465 [Gemmataceae bacterium]|nr:hypothetical protein [Gemmataceae bacterium]